MMKNGGTFLQNLCLALLSWQIGVHVENFFGMQESEVLGQIRKARVFELREQRLCEFLSADQNLPNLVYY